MTNYLQHILAAPIALSVALGSGCSSDTSTSTSPRDATDVPADEDGCSFDSDAPTMTEITVFNPSDGDLYLLTTPDQTYGSAMTSDGTEFPLKLRDCLPECQEQPEEFSCDTQALIDMAVRIAPGGSHRFPWDGRYNRLRTLPASCDDGEEEQRCIQKSVAVAGDAVRFEAFGAITCAAESVADSCTCSPDAEGSCIVSEATSEESPSYIGELTVLAQAPADGYIVDLAEL